MKQTSSILQGNSKGLAKKGRTIDKTDTQLANADCCLALPNSHDMRQSLRPAYDVSCNDFSASFALHPAEEEVAG